MIGAVSQCRCVMTPAFISDLETCIKNMSKLRPLKQYKPPQVSDPSISNVNFTPLPGRKTLFENLNFVFMSASDVKLSEELIKSLGGNIFLIDPLQQDRKNILLSASSIVMETRDLALNDYLRTTLIERDLAPTKHADLVLALFYVDKCKVFKKSSQLSQSVDVGIRVQDTQAMSLLPSTYQQSQLSNSKDILALRPTVVLPKHDKTVVSPLKLTDEYKSCLPTSEVEHKSKPKNVTREGDKPKVEIESANNTPDSKRNPITLFFEPSAVPPRLDKTITTPLKPSPNNSKPNTSFFEPSAVPPRLDKTIKTPLIPSPNNSKPNTSFFEPSAVPPRLDKTVETPQKPSLDSSKQNASFFDPSAIPPQLLSMTKTLQPSPLAVPDKFQTPFTPAHNPHTPTPLPAISQVVTPAARTPRCSFGSNTSLFDSTSKSIANQSITTPAKSIKTQNKSGRNKRRMSTDSDNSDSDENPFAASKSAKSYYFKETLSSFSSALNDNLKKAKLESPVDKSVSEYDVDNESTLPKIADDLQVVIKSEDEIEPCTSHLPVHVSESTNVEEPLGTASEISKESASDSPSPGLKRELLEKQESVSKKCKTDSTDLSTTSSCSNITAVPDMTQSMWMTRPKPNVERQFTSLSITETSANLVVRREAPPVRDVVQETSNIVNYKRFKRKGVLARSCEVTLQLGQFRKSNTKLLGASQASQVCSSFD